MNSLIKITANFSFTLFLCVLLAGCLSSSTQMGTPESKTVATGSSAGSSAQGTNSALERCYAPLGTVSFHEDKNETWYRYLTRDLRLTSTVPVLRLLAQQSNCFVVVERGEGMDDVMKERVDAKRRAKRRLKLSKRTNGCSRLYNYSYNHFFPKR